MTRKAFIADVASAAAGSIFGVSQVVRGAEDGELDFCFTSASGQLINVHILALDVSSYPSENTFMMYSETEDAPENVRGVLENLQNYSTGLRVSELISQIASELQKALADGSRGNPFNLEDDEMDEVESNDDDDWSHSPIHEEEHTYISINPEAAVKLNKRIRQDLRAVRNAGFRVGILRGLKADSQASVLSISVQVSRLGLSDEAIQAWDLEKQQHVVLLIRYSAGYKSFDSVINEAARSHEVEFRVGISNRYKPTVTEAIAAFTPVSKNESGDTNDIPVDSRAQSQANESPAGFSSLFISSSLNSFINEQFTSLLKIRHSMGVGWDGAKLFYSDNQGRAGHAPLMVANGLPSNYYSESTTAKNGLPILVTADHIRDTNGGIFSFPLIAMQFIMRYLTRCTEFCLICHDKTQETFEALKPYVCSKPLCLYQYINLGFGPSVEHEILTQPNVADLLISFCYASVRGRRLREYPNGMSLSVPPVGDILSIVSPYHGAYLQTAFYPQAIPFADGKSTETQVDSYKVKYDQIRHEIVLEQDKPCPVRRGDWVVLTTATNDKKSTHHKVLEILYPTVKLSPVVVTRATQVYAIPQVPMASTGQTAVATSTPTPPPTASMEMTIYNQNFDELIEQHKAESMIMLLETIPSIAEMRTYLKQQKHVSEPSLQTWTDRISPAALGLLRWIIASNRSSIVQVDVSPGQEESGDLKRKSKPDERVSNMEGYVQFRFAQGAPDKEHRFHKALEETQGRHNSTYPTIFAFHGSGLENWHSIIRSGLDFRDTLNGRACGNGVYHSLDYNTSLGYSREHSLTATWPGSELKITSAMCLNEIINAPEEYTNKTPHLVVQFIDWIQCRYLFVRSSSLPQTEVRGGNDTTKDSSLHQSPRNVAEIELDKDYMAKGTNRKPIGIPRNAFPASREFRIKSTDKSWGFSSAKRDAFLREALVVDETEDEEDLLFLISDDESQPPALNANGTGIWGWVGKGKGKRVEDVVIPDAEPRKRAKAQTDFIPDSLDQSTLQILEPPAYATSQATQILNRELKAILKVQDSTPLHELGWYINRNMIQTVYQWIVELHSFDAELPLSKDMKNAGIKSVVLEIRFGKDFPVSPPFVRVIRPRFLPFTMGGGGHVTGGGAMCMELLTNSGWSPVSSIESVLLQVRMAIMNLEPKPARLGTQGKQKQRDYSVGEAMDAYVRACRAHGWEVPKDFREFATGANGMTGLYGAF